MGNKISYNKEIFSSSDIKMINASIEEENPSLYDFYETQKSNGLKIKDLENILRLPTKDNFSQKILKIFCSEKKTIEYQQLKCLYFLFKYNPQVISNQDFRNRLYKLKKKFIAELLFNQKSIIEIEDYFNNVKLYFNTENDLQLLFDKYLQSACRKKNTTLLSKKKFIKKFGEETFWVKYQNNINKEKNKRTHSDETLLLGPLVFYDKNEDVNNEKEKEEYAFEQEDHEEIIDTCVKRKSIKKIDRFTSIKKAFKEQLSESNKQRKGSFQERLSRMTMSLMSSTLEEKVISLGEKLNPSPQEFSSNFYERFYQHFSIKSEVFISKNNKSFDSELSYICDCKERNITINYSEEEKVINTSYYAMSKKYFEIQKERKKFDIEIFSEIYHKLYHKKIGNEKTDPLIILLCQYFIYAQQDLITFNHFIEAMKMFAFANNEKKQEELMFTLLSRNGKIKKFELENIFKDKKEILDILSQYNSPITKEEFSEIYVNFSEIFREFVERINLIPYLYFNLIPPKQIIVKQCLLSLIFPDNFRTFENYLSNAIFDENTFYAIPSSFVKQLEEYVNSDNENKQRPTLEINEIASKNQGICKLKTKVKYRNDFLIFPESIYSHIKLWFGDPKDLDIKLDKIKYEESDIKEGEINYTEYGICMLKGKEVYEIEYHPITIIYIFLNELYDSFSGKTINKKLLLDTLKEIYDDKMEIPKRFTVSRKTQMKDVNTIIFSDKNISKLKPPISAFVYYNYDITEFDKNVTFEKEKIQNKCIIIIDSKYQNTDNTYFSEFENDENDDNKQQMFKLTRTLTYSRRSKVYVQENMDYSPIGFQNRGNACYLNSVLQIFINLPIFKQILIDNICIDSCIQQTNPPNNEEKLLNEFIKIIKKRWKNKNDLSNYIYDSYVLKQEAGKINKTFAEPIQQDANEFLCFFLNALNEVLTISKSPIINFEEINADKLTDAQLSTYCWSNEIKKNTSFIKALFGIQRETEIKCQKCNTIIQRFENDFCAFLPINIGNLITLKITLFRLPFTYKLYYEEKKEFKREKKIMDILTSLEEYYKKKNQKKIKK